MRSLVTIQKILEVKAIDGADAIELVVIKGWQCIAKKGEFKVGDCCVYFEVDSFLPIDERYEFLRRSSYRDNEFMGAGFRVKTMTMRGEISQGLALPIDKFPEVISATVGDDVTNLLNIRKWALPEQLGSAGIAIGNKPFGIPTTDETRIQSIPEILEYFIGKPYYISTKMDGTSCTIYVKDGKVGVCGRNQEYKEDIRTCSMWAYVYKHGLKEKLLALGENIVLQGEFCGQGIQKNPLKLTESVLFIFEIIKIDESKQLKKCGLAEIQNYCERLGIETVPIEEVNDSFNYTFPELLERASGKYSSGKDKEGIVVRTQEFQHNNDLQHKMSFKVINNDFLKKEKD